MLYNGQYYVQVIDLQDKSEVREIGKFLQKFSLDFTEKPDYTIAFYNSGDDKIIATGSFKGEVLRNIAVDCEWQGEGLMVELLTRLLQELNRQGQNHAFIYTKPENKEQFISLGFRFLGEALPYAVLLEGGIGTVNDYCDDILKRTEHLSKGKRAGIVMNCNPFTLGHRYLVEKAAAENEEVIVFLLSANKAEIPFPVRYKLLCEGVKDLRNVVVVEAGKYIISMATFPNYFLKKQDLVEAQTILDADIFARSIAPKLKIVRRYVGQEPYCQMTAEYNKALKKILPECGIEVQEIPRMTDGGGEFISASLVRRYLKENDISMIKEFVQETTYQYFLSSEGREVIKMLRNSSK